MGGIASGGIEILNFGAYLNDKYTVTDKLGSALSDAVESGGSSGASSSSSTPQDNSVSNVLGTVKKTIEDADKEIGFKDTFGTIATSASDLAFQAVDKAVELNDKYKVTDQITEKISEAASSAKTTSSK